MMVVDLLVWTTCHAIEPSAVEACLEELQQFHICHGRWGS
jgi:hypothetical protein